MTVKVFRSTDFGAPANTNAAGALIAILDACLVNGYGSQTVTSITRTGAVATVTLPAAHLLKGGTFVRISGATQTDYNGDFAITVTGANTFTYTVANSPATPATGIITSKVAPADWTKPFTGTNVAAFKQGAGSNGMYLRVSDTTTAFARVKAFEVMTDISTGTGDFPTEAQATGGKYFHKNAGTTINTTVGYWVIVATEKALFALIHNANCPVLHFFGDFTSNKSGDIYNTIFAMADSSTDGTATLSSATSGLAVSASHYLARNHTQIGTAIQANKITTLGLGISGNGGIPAYPCAIDNALHLSPFLITEPAGIRGKLPCFWNILHTKPFANFDIITGTGDFTGKKFIALDVYTGNYQIALEISNTW